MRGDYKSLPVGYSVIKELIEIGTVEHCRYDDRHLTL
jgi:hypothetical protein